MSSDDFRTFLDAATRALDRLGDADAEPCLAFDPAGWGARGAYYLRRERTWVQRHVESLEVGGERYGRRQLTIDVTLPEDEEPVIASGGGRNLYCLPAALIGKPRPRSRIDFLDETERRLPLLTRDENGLISFFALQEALRREINDDPPDAMVEAAARMVAQAGRMALFQLYLFEYAAKKELPHLTNGPAWPHIRATVESLVNDSIVWVPLEGLPGQRRSIRLSYEIGIGPPSVVARRERERTVALWTGSESIDLPVPMPAGIDLVETVTRVANRLGVALGTAAIDLEFRRPALDGTSSYHFQVKAPPGLDVRRVVVKADLCDVGGGPAREERLVAPDSGHLYIRGHRVRKAGNILVGLRPSRAGLVNQAFVSCAVISALLWSLATHWDEASATTNSQSAAAMLLIAPAVLAAIVYRPEHELAARLLAGVRGLVLLAALASVAQVGSLVGAVRFGMHPVTAAHVYAGVATFAAAWLALIWVVSLPWRRIGASRRFWWTQAAISGWVWYAAVAWVAILTVGATLYALEVARPGMERLVALSIPMLPLVYVTGWGAGTLRQPRHVALRLHALTTVAVLLGVAVAQTSPGGWHDARPTVVAVAVAAELSALLAVSLGLITYFDPRRRQIPHIDVTPQGDASG